MRVRMSAVLLFPAGLAVTATGCDGAKSVAPLPDARPAASLAGFSSGIITTFVAAERPEGIAMSKSGDLYVGISTTGNIYRLRPGHPGSGEVRRSLFATLGAGLLGLAVDAPGNLYAAVASFNPATHGVWCVAPDGVARRLPGSTAIFFPNALAFDDRGNLYVTSSSGPPTGPGAWRDGQIWRLTPGGDAAVWLEDALLTGDGSPVTAPPFPLGANGIAYRQGELLVVNTELGLLVRVPIAGDAPGTPATLASGFSFPDGLALDVHGDIYLLEIGLTRLVRVSGDGSAMAALAGPLAGVHFATSLTFGTGTGDRQSAFLANAALPLPHPAPVGPSVLVVDVGAPGQPLP